MDKWQNWWLLMRTLYKATAEVPSHPTCLYNNCLTGCEIHRETFWSSQLLKLCIRYSFYVFLQWLSCSHIGHCTTSLPRSVPSRIYTGQNDRGTDSRGIVIKSHVEMGGFVPPLRFGTPGPEIYWQIQTQDLLLIPLSSEGHLVININKSIFYDWIACI